MLLACILLVWSAPALAQPSLSEALSSPASRAGVSDSAETGADAVQSVPAVDSAQLFELHCAGCHSHGGNIVRRGKTLKLKALQKYQMDSAAAIAQIISLGRGNMSAYQDRLTPDQIEALAVYVLEQAQQGWPR
ncbi:MAG: c-type cytochrome [Elainella sp.]